MNEEQIEQFRQQIEGLRGRVQAEEQRNGYLVAWLWIYGNTESHPTLASEARRLALGCDPNLIWSPAPPAQPDPQ